MSKEQFLKENQKAGEVYAGLILGKDGAPDHHLFLLPGDVDKVTFKAAETWAKKQGGSLPTRREQSLLFANLKEQFQSSWYWSGEPYASDSSYAWCQYFSNGNQYSGGLNGELRARAVRRLIIE